MSEIQYQESFSIRDVTSIIFRRKWLIILPIILVTCGALATSFWITPLYRSSSIIWIDRPGNLSAELVQLIGGGRGQERGPSLQRGLRGMENELKSQTYLVQLIEELNLDDDPDVIAAATRMREQSPQFSIEQMKMEILFDELRSQISLKMVADNQIEIIVESSSPSQARDMVDHLAKIMEREKTRYELVKILDNQTWADRQLEKMENDYKEAVDSLTAAQSRLAKMNLPENISSEENRHDIISDIDKARFDMADVRKESRSLLGRLRQAGLGKARLEHSREFLQRRTDINRQIGNLVDMMEKYVWNNQNVINANIRINDNMRTQERTIQEAVDLQFADTDEDVRELLRQYLVDLEHIDVFNSKVTKWQNSLDKIDDRIDQGPRMEAEIFELQNRVIDARRYRDAFEAEEATVEMLSERVRDRTVYRIIEPARVPVEPFWPNRRKLLLLGFALGMVIGAAAVFLTELFDNSFKKVEDVESVLGVPVLATVPRIENLKLR